MILVIDIVLSFIAISVIGVLVIDILTVGIVCMIYIRGRTRFSTGEYLWDLLPRPALQS